MVRVGSGIHEMMGECREHTSEEAENGYPQDADLLFEDAGRVEVEDAVFLIEQPTGSRRSEAISVFARP